MEQERREIKELSHKQLIMDIGKIKNPCTTIHLPI